MLAIILVLPFLLAGGSPMARVAGQAAGAAARTEAISRPEKDAVVKALCGEIEKLYAFVENVRPVCDLLKGNLAKGAYDSFGSPGDFASRLNDDLRAATGDKHFGITYDPPQAAAMADDPRGDFMTPAMVERYRRNNFGFQEMKVLEGNVGYLDLRDFFPLRWSAGPATAAMAFLAECDTIVVDLRWNGGGEDSTVTFLLSYFFDPREPLTFTTTHSRATDTYYRSATWPFVPGKSLANKPLYVLTSRSSFSAAEAFAFRLKARGRAVLVGETTRGGAHPVEIVQIDRKYVAYIPSEKRVGSETEDWEGVGVTPDIETDAGRALEVAHEAALKSLAAKAADENARFFYRWALDGVRARIHPAAVDPALLASCAGRYGDWEITFENRGLRARRGDRAKLGTIPAGDGVFLVETMDSVRLRFVVGAAGVEALEILYDDGRTRRLERVGALNR